MIKYISILICILTSFNAFSTVEENQVKILSDTHQALDLPQANEVWPGYNLQKMPTIVHFENGHLYSFNLDLKDWEILSHSNPRLSFSANDEWGVTEVKMQPAFPIGDKEAFIFAMNSEIPEIERPIFTFVHERFHLHQFDHFNRPEEGFARYMDEWNEDNQVLIGVENWLLTNFLKDKKIEWLKDYVAVAVHRRQIVEVPTHAWENLQQRMEGLADYVSYKTYEVFPIVGDFDMATYILEGRQNKLHGNYSILTDAMKSRHYFVGAALGIALDFCDVKGWKQEVEKGAPLQLLLDRAIGMSDDEIDERVARLKSSPDYAEIESNVLNILAYEKEQVQNSIESYKAVEGVVVGLSIPRKPISGGGEVGKRSYIGKGATMNIRDTSVSSSQDQDWQLSFKRIPYMVEDQRGVRTFKLNPQTMFEIDQERFCLQDLQKENRVLSFESLAWNDSHSEFACKLSGLLHIKDGKVFVQFIPEQAD